MLVPGGQPGSLVHSANGFGSSSAVPGLSAPASPGVGAIQGDASHAPALALLLTVLLLGAGVLTGFWASRGARRRARETPRVQTGPPVQ